MDKNDGEIKINNASNKSFDIKKSGPAVDLRPRDEFEKFEKEIRADKNFVESKKREKKLENWGIKKRNWEIGKLGNKFKKFLNPLNPLYLLAFLLPIFVLPFSTEIYEFNKTLLLFFISGLAFLLWLAKMILIDKKIEIVRTPLDLPIVIFISLVLVSTAFSVDKVSSVLGFYGRFSDSLLVYLSLAMVYFTGVNNIGNRGSSVIASGAAAERGNLAVNGNDSDSRSDDANNEIASPTARNDGNNFIRAFLASSFIIVVASLIYSFGFKFIPWDEAQFRSFNLTGGSLNILAIYLTAVILIALGWRGAGSKTPSVLRKHLMSVLIIMSLILLTLVDFILAWIVLAVCLVLALGLMGARKVIAGHPESKGAGYQGIFAPFLILLISLAFIATSLTALNDNVQDNLKSSLISSSIKNRLLSSSDNQSAGNDGFTREVILDKKTAASITITGLENVKTDPISVIIGSGPGTYLYNFAKYKPAEFNNSNFWNLRFDKAGSEILEKISTLGVLGTLSYLIIIVLVTGMFLKVMFRKIPLTPFDKGGNIYLFAAWLGLLLFQFLYLESTTIKFVFWLLTMVLAVEYYVSARNAGYPVSKDTEYQGLFVLNLKKEPSAFYSSLAVLLAITVGFGYSCCRQISFYQGEMIYKNTRAEQDRALENGNLASNQAWEILDRNEDDLKKAVAKNPYRGEYKTYLSDIYLNRANLAFQEESKKSKDKKNTARIATEVKNAIDYAKSAADSSPNNIIFQQKLAAIYAALAKSMEVAGASDWAVKSYQKAIELEPTNPILRAELGKIYAAGGKTDSAISEFTKALELKNNYSDAGLQLGLAYEKQGNNKKAVDQLNSLGSIERIDNFIASGKIISSNSSSIDIDIAFQLGRIYYNQGKTSKAKSIFLKIIKVNPTHSNAHYSLGLIYEKEGNDEMALREFEIVLAANPENSKVISKVNELRGMDERIGEKEKKIEK